jgi:hypothetical protein
MKKELKIGDKVKGIKFRSNHLLSFFSTMKDYIDKEGVILYIEDSDVKILFPDGAMWWYPKNAILKQFNETVDEPLLNILL